MAMIDVDRRPVIYAGRFADQMADADLPDDCVVLGERDALSRVLHRANTLVFVDLFSFPFEAVTADHWDVPMIVVLPTDLDAESLTAAYGSALFERLGRFDRVVTSDPDLREELRRKYGWAESQLISTTSENPGEVARTICALLKAEPPTVTAKVLHRAKAAALEPRFATARGDRDDAAAPLDVLEVGAGAGRWASSFDPKTRFVGIDAREDLLGTARADFPDRRFDLLGSDLLFPYEDESFDLVFGETVMCCYPAPAKRTLLSEMWRVARPGASLLFLENFVFTREPEESGIYPVSVTEFSDLILDATAGQVILEHVESLRYPGEDSYRGGLISLLRLGVSRTRRCPSGHLPLFDNPPEHS